MKEADNGGGLPHGAEGRRSDISGLSANDRSEAVIEGAFRMCAIILENEKLPDVSLERASEAMQILLDAWHRESTDPLVQDGAKVLQSHFARVFDLEPTASYQSVLGKALSSRYFEGRNPYDPELKAFSQLMRHDLRMRDMDPDRNNIEVDFSGLVNPNYRPPNQA